MATSNNVNTVIEDAITLHGLGVFLSECDKRYARSSAIKTYGLSINNRTVSLVEGGNTSSVTVPETTLTKAEIDAAVSAAFGG